VTAMTRLKQKLFRLLFDGSDEGKPIRMLRINWTNRYQGHVSAALVLGGVDAEGAHIYTVYPHGSVDRLSSLVFVCFLSSSSSLGGNADDDDDNNTTIRLPYAAMGSGELCAMSVFESGYKDDLDEKEAIDLVDQAIQSGGSIH